MIASSIVRTQGLCMQATRRVRVGGIAAAPAVLPARRHPAISVASSSHAEPLDALDKKVTQEKVPVLGHQLRQQACGMAAVLPLASTSLTTGAQGEIYFGIAKALDVYLVILTVRILLSWFRNINWFGEPFNTLRQLTDPFLQMFRGIIPAIGGIDLSPVLGFFLLNLCRNFCMGLAIA